MYRRVAFFSSTLVVVVLCLASCNNGKKEQNADEKTVPLQASALSGAFSLSFSQLLKSYYELKDAFVAGDTVKVNAAAATVQLNVSNLKISEIGGDSTGTIKETAGLFASSISNSATTLTAQSSLEDKRREFNMISDAMWSLTRTVRFDGEKVYYQYCPMAFDNAGAYWLSNSRKISNPYFGEKMLTCGEVTDSLDYSKR